MRLKKGDNCQTAILIRSWGATSLTVRCKKTSAVNHRNNKYPNTQKN